MLLVETLIQEPFPMSLCKASQFALKLAYLLLHLVPHLLSLLPVEAHSTRLILHTVSLDY